MSYDHRKYRPFPPVGKTNRRWPDQIITQTPKWCSVDLRDGNQALVKPMDVTQKMQMFELLVQLGFKEIEVGFPAASKPDFDFVRKIITEDRIPQDVTIQVLTQARPALINKSFEALRGARRAIMHLYNSTSRVQREQVFNLDREGIKAIAVTGAETVKTCASKQTDTDWVFQYSPESFTGTELDFALEVCDSVINVWQPQHDYPVIINLPSTVEMATPNIFADQVEWFCDHIKQREHITVSVHTHNDRGCAVAAAELAVMAGADRVEGTLLGNGERTGNLDIVTMAMNLYSQGIDPALDLSNMAGIIECSEACTDINIHPRHPYAGELVYTAFSGSHQDAIRKGIKHYKAGSHWEVPYLPIDPRDLGRRYEEVVRINSQSGKAGVAHVLERDYGISLPRWLQQDFSIVVQAWSEQSGKEVTPEQIWTLFCEHYAAPASEWQIQSYTLKRIEDTVHADVNIGPPGSSTRLHGSGHGVVEALVAALAHQRGIAVEVEAFDEHALSSGTTADAIACIRLRIDHNIGCAVAFTEDTASAALQAVLTAVGSAISVDTSIKPAHIAGSAR